MDDFRNDLGLRLGRGFVLVEGRMAALNALEKASIPQIPDDVHTVLTRGNEPTSEQEKRSEGAIRAACEALRPRAQSRMREPDGVSVREFRIDLHSPGRFKAEEIL